MVVKTVCIHKHKDWHTVPGQIGTNDCQIAVDSRAEITVVSADLVPEAAKTGERQWIRGVHPYEESVPLARVLIKLANQKMWVTAAAVEDLPFDVLLGRDCDGLPNLMIEVAIERLRQTGKVVTVVTRQQAKSNKSERNKDLAADLAMESDDCQEYNGKILMQHQYDQRSQEVRRGKNERKSLKIQRKISALKSVLDESNYHRSS